LRRSRRRLLLLLLQLVMLLLRERVGLRALRALQLLTPQQLGSLGQQRLYLLLQLRQPRQERV
jgi:hypothetical protein